MKVHNGDDIIVLVDAKTTYHAESHKLNISPEKKERRTKDTGGRTYAIGDRNWTISGNGLACVREPSDDGEETLDTQDMMELALLGLEVDIVITNSIDGTGFKGYKGKGHITSFDLEAGTGADATYSYTIEGSGLTKVS